MLRALSAALVLAFAYTSAVSAAVPDYIAKAVADPSRPADSRELDAHRKPAETLAFAGVKPGMTVGEFLPGGGYYTRLLSDVVGPKGKVYALETTRWGKDNIEATKKGVTGLKNVTLDLSPFGAFNLPEPVDVFWTTLNYHDLHIEKYGKVDMAAFNKHVFDSLKPGGIYFIVDHMAAPVLGKPRRPRCTASTRRPSSRKSKAPGSSSWVRVICSTIPPTIAAKACSTNRSAEKPTSSF